VNRNANAIDEQCQRCAVFTARLDQSGWCEQCVIDLDSEAELLFGLEDIIAKWQNRGYPPEHLEQALRMGLRNAAGPLPGVPLRRRPVISLARGFWSTPASAFDRVGVEPNQIRRLRRRAGMSLERLAGGLGVSTQELGIWESGGVPQRDKAQAMAAWFGVSLDQLLGCEAGPGRDSLQCNRCGDPAPRDRFEQGWDVARGVELVCPYCLCDGDADWPSATPSEPVV